MICALVGAVIGASSTDADRSGIEMQDPSPPSKVKNAPGAYAELSCPRERVIVGALSVLSSSSDPRNAPVVATSVSSLRVVNAAVVSHAVPHQVHHQLDLGEGLPMPGRVP